MRPELTTNEKKFTYAKYFDYPMTEIPQEKAELLQAPLTEEQIRILLLPLQILILSPR